MKLNAARYLSYVFQNEFNSISHLFRCVKFHFQFAILFFAINWLELISVSILLFIIDLVTWTFIEREREREQIAYFMAFQRSEIAIYWFYDDFQLAFHGLNQINCIHNKMANCSVIADSIIATSSSIFLLSNAIEWRRKHASDKFLQPSIHHT